MLTGSRAGGQTQLCKENLPCQEGNALRGRVGDAGRRVGDAGRRVSDEGGWVILEGGMGAASAHHNEGGAGACPQ